MFNSEKQKQDLNVEISFSVLVFQETFNFNIIMFLIIFGFISEFSQEGTSNHKLRSTKYSEKIKNL